MFVHRLDRRLAFTALASAWVGRSALRLVVVYAGVACVLSMWMSNTATTAMLFPLGLAVLAELGRGRGRDRQFEQFAMAMMLVTSFAASIGGIAHAGRDAAEPDRQGIPAAGRREHLVCRLDGPLRADHDRDDGLRRRSTCSLPRARKITLGEDARRAVHEELRKLGPVSVGERNVIIAFVLTVAMWVVPGLAQAVLGLSHPISLRLNTLFPESIAALIGAVFLFLMPINWRARKFTMSWEEASRIDWGIVLLFGGGLAMGQLADSTGLAAALGKWVAYQFPGSGTVGLTLVFTAIAVVLSETASNTAAANVVVPTAIAVAKAAGVSPLEPGLGATLGASLGFMMPISTPPNAIVYSSGYIPIGTMMRQGIALDIVGYVIIVVGVLGFGWMLK